MLLRKAKRIKTTDAPCTDRSTLFDSREIEMKYGICNIPGSAPLKPALTVSYCVDFMSNLCLSYINIPGRQQSDRSLSSHTNEFCKFGLTSMVGLYCSVL